MVARAGRRGATPRKVSGGTSKPRKKGKAPLGPCIFTKHFTESPRACMKECPCSGDELRAIPNNREHRRLTTVTAASKAGDPLLWCRKCERRMHSCFERCFRGCEQSHVRIPPLVRSCSRQSCVHACPC